MSDHNQAGPLAEHLLVGIDGGNPLAFLAALGALRSLSLAWPERHIRMSWRTVGSWKPVLHFDPPTSQTEIVQALDVRLKLMQGHETWGLGKNLSVDPSTFRSYASRAARATRTGGDRVWADFAAAFGCEATTTDNDLIQDTALRTMSGAGHQHFLEFMRLIVDRAGPEHIEKALFHTWRYDDPVEKQTLRWDPSDDVRRALRWRDPSGDPQRRRRGGMLGANRLAIEGLPLLPTIPVGSELRTTGFSGRGAGETGWTWPIWSEPLSVDVVRSVLALELLKGTTIGSLNSMGIAAVYRARRLTVGKFRSFAPAEPI